MEPKTSRQMLATFAGDLIHFLYGFSVGFSSPSEAQMISDRILTSSLSSWFINILIAAQIIGTIIGPPLADRLGRKKLFLFLCPVSVLGWVLVATSESSIQLFIGRSVHGLVEAMMCPASIMFVSEVSEEKYRGMFLNTASVLCGFGIVMAYIAGALFHWRYTPFAPIVANILAMVLFLWLKESPLYLASKQDEDAHATLAWYRKTKSKCNREEVQQEMKNIQMGSTNLSIFQTLKKLKEKDNYKPFLIAFVVFFLYPMTGVYSITFFAVSLFKSLDLGSEHVVAITSAVVRMLGTVFSSFLIYRYGRRWILIVSLVLSTLTISSTGALVLLKEQPLPFIQYLSWILVVLIFIFMFSMGLGIVSIPFILLGEWFTADMKSLVSGVLYTTQFTSMFLSVQLTGAVKEMLGVPGLFLTYGVICLIFTMFAVLFVPETHGRPFPVKEDNYSRLLTNQNL